MSETTYLTAAQSAEVAHTSVCWFIELLKGSSLEELVEKGIINA